MLYSLIAAWTLTYSIIFGGQVVSTSELRVLPTKADCIASGERMKRELAKGGVVVKYTCKPTR